MNSFLKKCFAGIIIFCLSASIMLYSIPEQALADEGVSVDQPEESGGESVVALDGEIADEQREELTCICEEGCSADEPNAECPICLSDGLACEGTADAGTLQAEKPVGVEGTGITTSILSEDNDDAPPEAVNDFDLRGYVTEDGDITLGWTKTIDYPLGDASGVKDYLIYYEYEGSYFSGENFWGTVEHVDDQEDYSLIINADQLETPQGRPLDWGEFYIHFFIVARDNNDNISEKAYSSLLDCFRPGFPPDFDITFDRDTQEYQVQWSKAKDYPLDSESGVAEYTLSFMIQLSSTNRS